MAHPELSPPISAEIAPHCHDLLGRPTTFTATFSFDADDPYTVWVTFRVPAGRRRGDGSQPPSPEAHPRVGDDDVCLWPTFDEHWRAVVRMELHSPAGPLRVRVS